MDVKEYFSTNIKIPISEEYSRDVSLHLCNMSELTYLSDNEILVKDILSNYDYDQIRYFNNEGTQAILIKSKGSIIISFRGTEEAKDVITDLNLIPTGGEIQGLVHKGFKTGLDRVWKDIQTHLDLLYTENDTIYITGHSLGGALATVAAARSKYICQVYTFGQPRVGNRKYRKNIKSKIYRHVNGADIVPSVPVGFLYSHMGDTYHIDKKKKICYKVSSTTDFIMKRWKSRIRSLFCRTPLLKMVTDHKLHSYKQYL